MWYNIIVKGMRKAPKIKQKEVTTMENTVYTLTMVFENGDKVNTSGVYETYEAAKMMGFAMMKQDEILPGPRFAYFIVTEKFVISEGPLV